MPLTSLFCHALITIAKLPSGHINSRRVPNGCIRQLREYRVRVPVHIAGSSRTAANAKVTCFSPACLQINLSTNSFSLDNSDDIDSARQMLSQRPRERPGHYVMPE